MTPRIRLWGTVAAILAVMAVMAIYYSHVNPTTGSAPRCLFRLLTGYDCPGCGSQRAFHALLHGHLAAAWHYNPFVFFAVPTAVFYIVVEADTSLWPRLHARLVHPAVTACILISIILWWIVRNL